MYKPEYQWVHLQNEMVCCCCCCFVTGMFISIILIDVLEDTFIYRYIPYPPHPFFKQRSTLKQRLRLSFTHAVSR